jgi:hypothetical protein
MKYQTLLLSLLFLVLSSCSSEGDCTDKTISTTSLESEYNCTNTKNDLDLELSDDYIIIRDQSSFNNRVSGNCEAEIDFSTYDLVIGKKQLTTGNESIEYELTEICDTGNLVLKVTFKQNEATVAPNLTFHRLIPKMAQGKELAVITEIEL